MTVAYNKRPKSRGYTHESQNPVFVKWQQPKAAASRVATTVIGIIPIVVLLFFNWVNVEGNVNGFGAEAEATGVSMIKVVTDPSSLKEIILDKAFILGNAASEANIVLAESFADDFDGFSWIYRAIGGAIIVALLCLIISIVKCKSKARLPLAYLGFMLASAAPIAFSFLTIHINGLLDDHVLKATVFPFVAVLTGVLSLIYCIRYPVSVPAVGKKRNSFLTRFLTGFVPVKGDGAKEGVRKVIFTTALISFVYFGLTLGYDLYKEYKAGLLQDKLKGLINADVNMNDPKFDKITERAKPLPDYMALWNENNDMVGYIRVGNTKVDYPVLQTDNNEYYVDHDFYGEFSKGGAIFADRFNNFKIGDDGKEKLSGNTILYGHNIYTGNYFAALSNYHRRTTDGTLEFYKTNPVIDFHTLYNKHEWKVFACVLFNTQPAYGEVIRYWDMVDFYDENHFNDYIMMIMNRSVLYTDVDIEYGDEMLTMSTCFYPYEDGIEKIDTRCVVFARRVRDGESRDVDTDKATYNRRALRFEGEKQRIGSMYPGYLPWHTCEYFTSYDGECEACANGE